MSSDLPNRLETYLAIAWPEQAAEQVVACTPMATGWENEMYLLDPQNGRQAALRMYPGHGAARKAERESQGMRTLYDLGYPVPQGYAVETDAVPLGKPFLLMEYVQGQTMMDAWTQRNSAGQAASMQVFV